MIVFIFLVLKMVTGYAQYEPVLKSADSLYLLKQYVSAAEKYLLTASGMPEDLNPKSCYYNAACCYALAGDHTKAKKNLDKALYEYQYKNYSGLLADKDFASLHTSLYWKKLEKYIAADLVKLSDPRAAKLVTTDIHNFWKAYDAAAKDTAHRKQIFQDRYFGKGTPGLRDYYITKIGSVEAFVQNQDKKKAFYKAIRPNTLAIDAMKDTITGYFVRLKELYPDAVFPNIYFVIGKWKSAGTVSDNGMLIGVDQIVKSPGIPEAELNLWEKNNFQLAERLPVIVTHELIHSQQTKMRQDTALLFYAIVEGMADFMCELITGKNPSQRQHEFAKTRKKQIWEDFKKEMYLQRYSNWIANSNQETPDKPADLGYYVGYEICKAYYDNAADKKQAIQDFFNLKDYKGFLEKSGYDERMEALPQ
ncbi:MAG: hypothetical protein EOO13_01325 [Chitinophagaceae bacterium]|nr:MAG: hypothetical protein EOO13_01325 [Chitinophagaceae bacterium]